MNKIYNTLIVDDEPYAHTLIESYCEKLNSIRIVGNCYNGLEVLEAINKQPVDLLLLDIQMPEISGIELLETLQEKSIKVIMITAFSHYAIETYNYDAVVDYLLKPVKFVRFVKALERVKKTIALEEAVTQSGVELEGEVNDATFFCIQNGKIIHKIAFEALMYVQSYGNYVKLFLSDGEVKVVRNTISKLDGELAPFKFCRIHKSYLVNLRFVNKVEVNRIELNEVHLPIGNSYAQYFKEKLLNE